MYSKEYTLVRSRTVLHDLFWLFVGQCKSIADQRNYYIFLEAKWQFAWVD